MVRGILDRVKRYVSVEASTDADGAITPKAVLWGDGRRFGIDEVVDARKAASLKVGGAGTRYTVRIGDAVTYLFHEDPRWFCEAKVRGFYPAGNWFPAGELVSPSIQLSNHFPAGKWS